MPQPDAPAPTLNPHLKKLLPYPPGRPIEEVQREFGLKDVVKLASNENPLGPSPRAMKAMAKAAGEMSLYPDGNGYYLKAALSKRLGVSPEDSRTRVSRTPCANLANTVFSTSRTLRNAMPSLFP
jgi:histidinol-phosphate aminotransferase